MGKSPPHVVARAPALRGIRVMTPLASADATGNRVGLSLRYVLDRTDRVAVRAVAIGGVDGALYRTGDVRRLIRFHSLEDDRLTWMISLRRRCPSAARPASSRANRPLRSRAQRELGLPDSGKRTQTPTRPVGSGSPCADPTIWCSSNIALPPPIAHDVFHLFIAGCAHAWRASPRPLSGWSGTLQLQLHCLLMPEVAPGDVHWHW